jgi:type I restriction enzyme S subunit
VKATYVNYLTYYLQSIYALQYATEVATGIAQKIVPLTILRKMLVPLPPLVEQKRIVAKIDQLMQLCDSLDKHIKDSTEKKSAILNAVLAGV